MVLRPSGCASPDQGQGIILFFGASWKHGQLAVQPIKAATPIGRGLLLRDNGLNAMPVIAIESAQ
jgi:hypothetical protein